MRGAHAVFRAVLCMDVNGNVSHYELVFRMGGVENAIAIKRLENKLRDQSHAVLPFDPVVVELQSCADNVLVDSVPGSYAVKMAFLKRDRSGTIVASVPVNWVLSPAYGAHGELAAGAQSFLSPFVVTVHRALLNLRSWKAIVERPCIKSCLQPGLFTFEGFVKSALVEAGPRWWARLRIQAELLQNGTLSGICVGESHSTSVLGAWTADSFDISMGFQRPGGHSNTPVRLRLEGQRTSANRFTRKIQRDGDGLSRPFTFEIVRLGQPCSTEGQAIPPLAFYQEARLAVLSTCTKTQSAPNLLTGHIWRRIFTFYDAPWFVPVRPLKKLELYRRQVSYPTSQQKSELHRRQTSYPMSQPFRTVSNSDPSAKIVGNEREEPVLHNQLSSHASSGSPEGVVEQHWATVLYLVAAFTAITWSFHATPGHFSTKSEEDAALIDCARSVSRNSSYHDTIWLNGSAAGTHSWQRIKEPDTLVYHRSMLVLTMCIIANGGLALLHRIRPKFLIGALLTTGFLYSRLPIRRQGVGICETFVELCSEVCILLATVSWFHASSCAHTITSLEALSNHSRFAFWQGSYVLPFFAASNTDSIVAVLGSMMSVVLDWSDITISSYTSFFTVAVTAVLVGEVLKATLPRLFHAYSTHCGGHRDIVLVAITGMFVVSPATTVLPPPFGMLSIALLPFIPDESKFAATTQALLLGVFVQGFAAHLNQLQGRH